MSTIHTLENARAPERSDGVLWTSVRVEQTTDFVAVSTAATQVLNPPETNAASPLVRNITFSSSLGEGYFRLVFIDGAGNVSPPTAWVFDDGTGSADNVANPTVSDVAGLLQSRTRTRGGDLAKTFNELTEPTGAEVEGLISYAHDRVMGRVGEIPDSKPLLKRDATELIRLYAAMQIELGHYSEQVHNGTSPYKELAKLFEAGIAALIEGVGGEGDSAVDEEGTLLGATAMMPSYAFPPTSIGDGVMP